MMIGPSFSCELGPQPQHWSDFALERTRAFQQGTKQKNVKSGLKNSTWNQG